jgi:hypothetical protein
MYHVRIAIAATIKQLSTTSAAMVTELEIGAMNASCEKYVTLVRLSY